LQSSSSQNHLRFVVPSTVAKSTVEALRQKFAQNLAEEKVEHITCDPGVAIVTLVGQKMRGASEIMSRTLYALGREKVNVIALAQGSSDYNLSFVLTREDMKAALLATHGNLIWAARVCKGFPLQVSERCCAPGGSSRR
jgi:aspartokinase